MKHTTKLSISAVAAFSAAMLIVGCGGASGGTSPITGTTSGTTGTTNGSTTGNVTQKYTVVGIRVNKVEALDTFDVILVDKADFKGTIHVGSGSKSFPAIDNQDTITPGWSYSRNVTGVSNVSASVTMKEEDSGLLGADDPVDLDPGKNLQDVNVNINPYTGVVSGDVSGKVGDTFTMQGGGDSGVGRARITFTVTGS